MDPKVKADIKARTPSEWYGLASPRGWDEIVEALHLALVEAYPDYKVHQIKEKFGGLEYYTDIPYDSEPARTLIATAHNEALGVCQSCGTHTSDVKLRTPIKNGRVIGTTATTCDQCDSNNKRGYK